MVINQTWLAGLFFALASSQLQALSPNLNEDLTSLCASVGCVDYSGANAIPSYAKDAGDPTHYTKIAVKDWGPKKKGAVTLFLIHGYPHGQGLWIEQVKSKNLTDNFRIVTMDVRGSGLSEVPNAGSDEAIHYAGDIQAVIDRLDLKNVILVGHSYGGIVATAYVAVYGASKVKGMVWVGSMADLHNAIIPPSTFDILVRTLSPDPTEFEQATREFVDISHNVPFSATLTTKFFNMDMDTTLAGRLGHIFSVFASEDNTTVVNTITAPNLIIQGLSDAVIPPVNADNLQANLINARRVTRIDLPEIGHVPQLENPLAFNKALAKFASGL